MLKHIVMWRLADSAEGRTKAENARWMKEHLEALVGVVPQLLSAEVGINVCDPDMAYRTRYWSPRSKTVGRLKATRCIPHTKPLATTVKRCVCRAWCATIISGRTTTRILFP